MRPGCVRTSSVWSPCPMWSRSATRIFAGSTRTGPTRTSHRTGSLRGPLSSYRPAVPIDLVDTVGAGDSFTSGLLDGLHRADLIGGARRAALAAIDESTLATVVDSAVLVAAITCSRPGADPPTRAEVEATLAAR